MKRLSKFLVLGLFLALIVLPPLHGQSTTNPSADARSAADTAPASQAPDAMTNKITELVHAGKYAEAQQLTTGLLVAYPDDQRLIKAKALIERLLAPGGSATSSSPQPANDGVPAQPGVTENVEPLKGMDKVDYNALIELARQAQRTSDLSEQRTLLRQFMSQSGVFLQKYPTQPLLWQLRAASAISLDDPDAGYEAGQKLLAADAADSNDPNLQQLIAKLKIKGWLDRQGVEQSKIRIEEENKYGWLLGKWSVAFSFFSKAAFDYGERRGSNEVEFVKSDSGAEGFVTAKGRRFPKPAYRYAVRNSSEIALPTNWQVFPVSQWEPVTSVTFGSDRKSMTIVVKGHTYVLTKISDSAGQQAD